MPLRAKLKNVVGGKTAAALEKQFGFVTVDDLLRHYPRRYAERGELTDLAGLAIGESVTVFAEVESVSKRTMRARKGTILDAVVTDGKGRLTLTFFNQAWRERELRPGRRGLFSGEVSAFRGTRQLAHPQCLLLPDGVDDDPAAIAEFAGAIIPVYAAKGSLTSWQIAAAMRIALDTLGELDDPIPKEFRERDGLLELAEALRAVHRPSSRAEIDSALRRLKYEEALLLQTELAYRRAQVRAMPAIARVATDARVLAAFDDRLPFELTAGQREVGEQITHELAQTHPMHRLLQGDVGSGKTIVALRAMLEVVDAGGQAVLLAPTEVLAQQHAATITKLLGPLAEKDMLGGAQNAIKVGLLTGSQGVGTRRTQLLDAVSGDAAIVVGTHALLEEHVEFHDLALVVVDEQHRFGVEQRAALAAKSRDGTRPHVLVMTATPIPRTVAVAIFGDLDISTLSELPAGRTPITTHVVPAAEKPAYLERGWERIREEVSAGRRAYVVCPRIGDQDADDDDSHLTSVIELTEELQHGALAGLRVAMLHGRMSADVKDDVMRRFSDLSARDGIDVLVSTTVIEVGVDVPAATVMLIMDADRFGISQLHQLRGRVGRGTDPGLCLLVTNLETGHPGRERLAAVAATTDGFELSRLDLELRREGDVLGTSQSGRRTSLRLLEVLHDEAVIAQAREDALELLASDPELLSMPALRGGADYLEKA